VCPVRSTAEEAAVLLLLVLGPDHWSAALRPFLVTCFAVGSTIASTPREKPSQRRR